MPTITKSNVLVKKKKKYFSNRSYKYTFIHFATVSTYEIREMQVKT